MQLGHNGIRRIQSKHLTGLVILRVHLVIVQVYISLKLNKTSINDPIEHYWPQFTFSMEFIPFGIRSIEITDIY